MGKAIYDREDQLNYLKQRLSMFLEVLENIDPEETSLEDIDRLIGIIDELETKCEQFKKREEK
ncbi:SE1561 family protein [Peribacillus tepidiphilus]|jgi:septum formation inhibitor-activating ATPase MinD|uniref:SE1561 family protein n=1 Tax=Peribacillus tepidiphilus TaxID=2652445 RepID=UPI0035B54119